MCYWCGKVQYVCLTVDGDGLPLVSGNVASYCDNLREIETKL